jgi:hypothetical protein
VSPETVIGLEALVPENPPGLEVTVYPVIGEPPLFKGAVNDTVACAFPLVAVPIVGMPGTVVKGIGITEFEADPGELLPFVFSAITVNV